MDNSATQGGAIRARRSDVVVSGSTLSGNAAADYGRGGAIKIESGSLILTNSTLSGNTTDFLGGGIYLTGAQATLTNSTLSGNTSAFFGGGIWGAYAQASLTNSTLIGNVPGAFGNYQNNSSFSLANSIVADNGFCGGSIIDGGNNFSDDDTCGPGFADITPDVDFDTTLADNGGPTLTHALIPASVAIDAAGDCGLETDQRGFPRNDGACDSGSVEFQGGGDVPASTQLGLIVLIAVLVMLSWAIVRPKRGTRYPT